MAITTMTTGKTKDASHVQLPVLEEIRTRYHNYLVAQIGQYEQALHSHLLELQKDAIAVLKAAGEGKQYQSRTNDPIEITTEHTNVPTKLKPAPVKTKATRGRKRKLRSAEESPPQPQEEPVTVDEPPKDDEIPPETRPKRRRGRPRGSTKAAIATKQAVAAAELEPKEPNRKRAKVTRSRQLRSATGDQPSDTPDTKELQVETPVLSPIPGISDPELPAPSTVPSQPNVPSEDPNLKPKSQRPGTRVAAKAQVTSPKAGKSGTKRRLVLTDSEDDGAQPPTSRIRTTDLPKDEAPKSSKSSRRLVRKNSAEAVEVIEVHSKAEPPSPENPPAEPKTEEPLEKITSPTQPLADLPPVPAFNAETPDRFRQVKADPIPTHDALQTPHFSGVFGANDPFQDIIQSTPVGGLTGATAFSLFESPIPPVPSPPPSSAGVRLPPTDDSPVKQQPELPRSSPPQRFAKPNLPTQSQSTLPSTTSSTQPSTRPPIQPTSGAPTFAPKAMRPAGTAEVSSALSSYLQVNRVGLNGKSIGLGGGVASSGVRRYQSNIVHPQQPSKSSTAAPGLRTIPIHDRRPTNIVRSQLAGSKVTKPAQGSIVQQSTKRPTPASSAASTVSRTASGTSSASSSSSSSALPGRVPRPAGTQTGPSSRGFSGVAKPSATNLGVGASQRARTQAHSNQVAKPGLGGRPAAGTSRPAAPKTTNTTATTKLAPGTRPIGAKFGATASAYSQARAAAVKSAQAANASGPTDPRRNAPSFLKGSTSGVSKPVPPPAASKPVPSTSKVALARAAPVSTTTAPVSSLMKIPKAPMAGLETLDLPPGLSTAPEPIAQDQPVSTQQQTTNSTSTALRHRGESYLNTQPYGAEETSTGKGASNGTHVTVGTSSAGLSNSFKTPARNLDAYRRTTPVRTGEWQRVSEITGLHKPASSDMDSVAEFLAAHDIHGTARKHISVYEDSVGTNRSEASTQRLDRTLEKPPERAKLPAPAPDPPAPPPPSATESHRIPSDDTTWAQPENLKARLEAQATVNPDRIFLGPQPNLCLKPLTTDDLRSIFPGMTIPPRDEGEFDEPVLPTLADIERYDKEMGYVE